MMLAYKFEKYTNLRSLCKEFLIYKAINRLTNSKTHCTKKRKKKKKRNLRYQGLERLVDSIWNNPK